MTPTTPAGRVALRDATYRDPGKPKRCETCRHYERLRTPNAGYCRIDGEHMRVTPYATCDAWEGRTG